MTEKRKIKLEKWEAVVAGWRASGLSVAEYCRRNDIPAWKFRYWREKTNREARGAARGGRFVELPFSDSSADNGKLVVELASGVRIRLEAGFDPADLARVLRTLGGPAC
jgi:hypothetical protein